MNRYFHAYTKKYDKYRRTAAILTAVPLAQFSMLIIWALMFNLKRAAQPEFLIPYASAVGVSILAGMLLCWFYSAVAEHFTRVNRRYTYFEITQKAAVFSKYGGSYTRFGKRTILRRVCVIPLKSYENAYLDEKKKHLILTGEIRVYEGENKRLGYHIKDGFPVFDSWWYNEAEKSYKTVDMIRLPMDFEHPGKIAGALHRAKREFDAIPPKKEYVFKEADIVRKRRELKKLAESRRYIRTW
ncbi:MAG: hypothetical protein J1F60_03190 [Oscillospiraceae bacterium]|nr:hypothetical protein [Oscillospiraceae bacterium]